MSEDCAPGAPLAQLLALARERDEAGQGPAAARLYGLAAQQAAAAGDNAQAVLLLDNALRLTSDAAAGQRFELLARRETHLGRLGRAAEQKRDLAALEELAHQLDDDSRRALVAVRQADFRAACGDLDAAVSLARLALRLAQLVADDIMAAQALLTLGQAVLRQGEFDRAARHLRQAAARAEANGADGLRADALRHLGVLSNDQERFDQAVVYYQQATTLYQRLGHRRGLAQVHNNLGHVYEHQGHLAQAQAHWQETRRLFESVDDYEGSVRVLINLGVIHLDLGQYDAARDLLQQARVLAEQVQMAPGLCYARLNLALAAHRQGQNEEALAQAESALAIARQMGARRLEGAVLLILGHARAGLGQLAQAGDAYWESLAIWESLALPGLAAEARAGLARIALSHDMPSLAMFFAAEILTQLETDDRLLGAESPVQVLLTVYRVLQHNQDPRAARVLDAGYQLLQARSDGLADESARAAVRHNVPAHRELLAAVEDGSR